MYARFNESMDSLLILLSASLVGYKILETKRSGHIEFTSGKYPSVGARHQPPKLQQQPQLLNARPSSMSVPQYSEVPTKRLPPSDDDGTGVQNFNEQFFPQDSKSTGHSVARSPWMRAVETSQLVPPKTEREATHPSEHNDRDDIRGMKLAAVIREREHHEASVAISKQKKFQSPVKEEWTANGENRGLHPVKRYHKFVLSDQPVVEVPQGPRGNFASGRTARATHGHPQRIFWCGFTGGILRAKCIQRRTVENRYARGIGVQSSGRFR